MADLEGVEATRVCREAAPRGVEIMPLSTYYFGRGPAPNGLVLGFGATRPDDMGPAMETLAAAIKAARRP